MNTEKIITAKISTNDFSHCTICSPIHENQEQPLLGTLSFSQLDESGKQILESENLIELHVDDKHADILFAKEAKRQGAIMIAHSISNSNTSRGIVQLNLKTGSFKRITIENNKIKTSFSQKITNLILDSKFESELILLHKK